MKRVYMDCIKAKRCNIFVSMFIIWRQQKCRPRSAIRSLSSGRRAVSLWTKYVVLREIKPSILELSIRSGQIYFSIVLSAAKKLLSCSFGRTARFWLPLVPGTGNSRLVVTTFPPSSPSPTFLLKLEWERIISVNLDYYYYYYFLNPYLRFQILEVLGVYKGCRKRFQFLTSYG